MEISQDSPRKNDTKTRQARRPPLSAGPMPMIMNLVLPLRTFGLVYESADHHATRKRMTTDVEGLGETREAVSSLTHSLTT